MLVIVGVLTLGLTVMAARLKIGIPYQNSTLIGDVAKASVGHGLFAAFQLTTALLLLSAASSSFQAGPGLLKALARTKHSDGETFGILNHRLGVINKYYTPYISVILFLIISALICVAVNASDQKLVLFYAVAVYMSFLIGLLAMARFSWVEKKYTSLILNVIGAIVVGFTLIVNLARIDPIASIAAALAISLLLYCLWVRAGRPLGISQAITARESRMSQTNRTKL